MKDKLNSLLRQEVVVHLLANSMLEEIWEKKITPHFSIFMAENPLTYSDLSPAIFRGNAP